ncbi:MtN3 and saliva related transmembrane protein [Cnuella takakiae]|uniref:MtN3 and saliva related transmembrane protein n=1 Tax=Cnuella takakiae TaxID=1302690 RepID=A0A1M4UYP9_9BACT|nr:SemiSWEET transporter [Cnuella takakiae]SHE61802.1 MtN3 and saliva related transmembrane protein [Cnuella takakiae]
MYNNTMESMEWIGIAAGVLTAVSMLPQLVKVIREKHVEDLSIAMLLVLIAGLALWVVYGFVRKDPPLIYTNIFSVAVNLALVFFRVKYSRKKVLG